MPPKFSLQNVLDLRHDLVEALEVELSRLIQLKVTHQEALDAYLVLQKDLMGKLVEAQTGEMDLFKIKMLHENVLTVDRQIITARENLKKISDAVETKLAELIKARQSEETLETLKNKRIETFNAEQAQSEARAQDDIYIAQAFRNRVVEGYIR
jgi:flagellar export protein FliJ